MVDARHADSFAVELWHHPKAQLLVVSERGHVALRAPGKLTFTRPTGEYRPESDVFVGEWQGSPIFVRVVADDAAIAAAFQASCPVKITGLRPVLDAFDDEVQVAFVAAAIGRWSGMAKFCSRCGTALTPACGGNMRKCGNCRLEHFPRTDPAIIVAVTDADDRILLGRQPVWEPKRMSVLAGYVEAGESAEQAVHRELAEEVGLHGLTDVRYFASQPWPFPRSLMLAYTAHCPHPDQLAPDTAEIETARWFTRADFTAAVESNELLQPSKHSVAYRLIHTWLKR
ncbi:MAG: NAD(+) diphosphatase [Propionibacteriaceae bacterium]|nr:NAD(+) diphosphatase [Propionibacteriaceae bacterium]